MFFQAPLMGVNFRPKEIKDFLQTLQTGQQLMLEHEPTNEYDPNAVRVLFGDDGETPIFLGYVAKEVAAELVPYLTDETTDYKCQIVGWLGTIKPLLEIEIIQ